MVPAWVARDGRVIPLSVMETEHLINTIALLRKQGFITKEEMIPMPRPIPGWLTGEYAQDAAEQAFDQEMEEFLTQKVSKSLTFLEKELKSRRPK
jgi:hypothetical protein